jgi:hypothetical protein
VKRSDSFTLGMDSTAAAAAAAASAAVQALSEALQPAVFQHHKLTLPPFWTQDPVGWFLHAVDEFALARVPANSYVCYMHVVRALPSEVLTAVRDLIRDVTAATPEPYLLIKDALLSRFTSLPLQMCFKLLDLPPLCDRRPSALFAEMQSLLPRGANVLFNAMFLRHLPEAMRTALVDRGEVLPGELVTAADLLQHTAPLPMAALAPAGPAPAMPPVLSGPTVSAVQPSRRATSPSPSRFRHRPATPHSRSGSPGCCRFELPSRQRPPLPQPPPDSQLCFYQCKGRDPGVEGCISQSFSYLYKIQKRLYKDDIYTEYKNVCTKTTSTNKSLLLKHILVCDGASQVLYMSSVVFVM